MYCLLHFSVLDLNAFERQNKAEGLGMVTEEGSGITILMKKICDFSLHISWMKVSPVQMCPVKDCGQPVPSVFYWFEGKS